MKPLRIFYAAQLTRAHQAWIYRRTRQPWVWVLPIALTVSILRPH